MRAATPADVEFLVDSIRGLADYERLADQCAADPARLEEHLFGPRAHAESWIVELDGARAGYALCFTTYSTFLTKPGLYVEDLFVVPALRGRGAGRALLDAVVTVARERGYGRVEWSVLDWNEPAIRFYRGYGAEPQDDWRLFRLADEALTRRRGGARNEG